MSIITINISINCIHSLSEGTDVGAGAGPIWIVSESDPHV